MYIMAAVNTLSELPVGLISQGGFGALVTLAVWLIYTGRLVPRSTLQASEAREAKLEKVAEELLAQNRQLIENNRIVNDFMNAYPRPRDGAG